MDAVTASYNRFVKRYDRKLYVIKTHQSMHQIWREGDRPDCATDSLDGDYVLRPNPQFILPLTDDWTLKGKPVEWGKEPLRAMLRSMDSWSDDSHYQKMVKRRDEMKADTERQRKNDYRAKALDLRKDFAKLTNDIVVQK